MKKYVKISISIIILIVFSYLGFLFLKRNTEEKAIQEEYQRKRNIEIADSLREVGKQKAIYYEMINFISKRDSIKKTLRYRAGDIVYLKPDSIRCVIMDVSGDSSLLHYDYVLLTNNLNTEPGIIIRTDKLIY